jgi:hypothetical protein
MGLNCSHGAWDGAYSAFGRWREKIAEVAGLPPLHLMEGFYSPLEKRQAYDLPTLYCGPHEPTDNLRRLDALLPIKWESLKEDKLHILLNHSDCDGEIAWQDCDAIADSLEKLIPLLPEELAGGHIGYWREKTQTFVDGLRLAAQSKEELRFR